MTMTDDEQREYERGKAYFDALVAEMSNEVGRYNALLYEQQIPLEARVPLLQDFQRWYIETVVQPSIAAVAE
jgi:hypothetical protein